ncbi:MAG: hypothetical protein LBT40_06535 [Deltaproteobacteria bacterium]|jgi:hypothetical protein|nr:hypothetical protein [Deltaproteobacteria bacterium]
MKELTAVAHKIARAFCAMLRDGARYARESGAESEKRRRQAMESRLAGFAERMGYRPVPVGGTEKAAAQG